MTMGPASATKSPSAPQKRLRGVHVLLISAAILILVAVRIGCGMMWGDSDGPRMTRADFEAARDKWQAAGIKNYDVDVDFSGGDQRKIVHVEVRDGEVTKCVENGRVPTQERVWDDWTIESQFQMIGEDLVKSEDPVNGFRVRSNVVITLHANFDPELGYPHRYHRKARGATPLRCHWDVVLKPLPDGAVPGTQADERSAKN